jgi:hypothetical protein
MEAADSQPITPGAAVEEVSVVAQSGEAPGGDHAPEFSLVQADPFYLLLGRIGLFRPPLGRHGLRLAVIVLLAWLPLLLLAAASGELSGGPIQVPFLFDLSVHARLLGSMPLLLIAELSVHRRIGPLLRQFGAEGLIPPEAHSRYEEILSSSARMARWVVPEIVLLVIAFTLGHWFWSEQVALPANSWFRHFTKTGPSLTAAGNWYAFFSLPLYRFILYRWYFRLAIWYRLLWKISRLPLHLNAAYPDQAGGLGFLGQSSVILAPVFVAQTILVSGVIGDQVLHLGIPLARFKLVIGAALVVFLLIPIIPFFFFSSRLVRVRRTGISEHAVFATRYVEDFDRKWLRSSGAPGDTLRANADIQGLCELESHFRSMRDTRMVPIGKTTIISLVVLLALPFAPLFFAIVPLEEALLRAAKFVF